MGTGERQGEWESDGRGPRPWGHQLAFALAVVGLLAVSALSWSSWRTAVRELEHQQTREAELSREIRQLQASIERQRAYAERLETDDALAERVLRERLGYVRPGDIVFRFPSAR